MDAVTFQQEALRCERLLYHISYAMLKNNQDCADAVPFRLAGEGAFCARTTHETEETK